MREEQNDQETSFSAEEKEMSVNEVVDDLAENAQLFIKANIKSLQLEIYERTVNLISSGISVSIIIVLLMFTLLFINFGLAQYVGEYLDSPTLGYIFVAGFYFVALILYLALRNIVWPNNIKNAILSKISKEHEEFDDLLKEQDTVRENIEKSMYHIRDDVSSLKKAIKEQQNDHFDNIDENDDFVASRAFMVSSVDFVFRNFLFKKGNFMKREVIPLIANTFLTSTVYGEGKFKSLFKNIRQRIKNKKSN